MVYLSTWSEPDPIMSRKFVEVDFANTTMSSVSLSRSEVVSFSDMVTGSKHVLPIVHLGKSKMGKVLFQDLVLSCQQQVL